MEDEHLMTNESDWSTAQCRLLKDSQRRLKQWVAVLSVLLVLAVLGLALAMHHSLPSLQHSNSKLSVVPSILSTSVKFERDDRFAGPSSTERDQAWSALMPPGDGFVLLSNSTVESHSLPLGKSTARGQVYDISLFHQLHCLANIRMHLFTLQSAMARENMQEVYDVLLKPQEDHVFHCFDYIRQALMCAGDMTIEWPRTEEDGRRFAVDGWGITHECRSWEAIMAFMQEKTTANLW